MWQIVLTYTDIIRKNHSKYVLTYMSLWVLYLYKLNEKNMQVKELNLKLLSSNTDATILGAYAHLDAGNYYLLFVYELINRENRWVICITMLVLSSDFAVGSDTVKHISTKALAASNGERKMVAVYPCSTTDLYKDFVAPSPASLSYTSYAYQIMTQSGLTISEANYTFVDAAFGLVPILEQMWKHTPDEFKRLAESKQ